MKHVLFGLLFSVFTLFGVSAEEVVVAEVAEEVVVAEVAEEVEAVCLDAAAMTAMIESGYLCNAIIAEDGAELIGIMLCTMEDMADVLMDVALCTMAETVE